MNFKQLTRLLVDQNSKFLQSNQPVVLGLSGGLDSTALFHVFCQFRKLKKFQNFVVLHVNYGLRGAESDGDFVFCRQLAADHQVEFHVLDCQTQEGRTKRQRGESTQVWARRIRHEWFHEFSVRGYTIALAHHADDVAENVLFRLARGAMPENLAGMSRFDPPLWRPLISTTRSMLLEAMTDAGYEWREDSSNRSKIYTRNRIRHIVLQELEAIAPGAASRIAEFGKVLATPVNVGRSTAEMTETDMSVVLAEHERSRQKVQNIRVFLDTATSGQSLDLGEGFTLLRRDVASQDSKTLDLAHQAGARALQHAHGIDIDRWAAVTSGESELFVPKPAIFSEFGTSGLMHIQIGGKNDQESAEIMVGPPTSDHKVTFAGLTSAFKFKALMQKWKVGVLDRLRFVIVKTTRSENVRLVKLFESGKT